MQINIFAWSWSSRGASSSTSLTFSLTISGVKRELQKELSLTKLGTDSDTLQCKQSRGKSAGKWQPAAWLQPNAVAEGHRGSIPPNTAWMKINAKDTVCSEPVRSFKYSQAKGSDESGKFKVWYVAPHLLQYIPWAAEQFWINVRFLHGTATNVQTSFDEHVIWS